MFLRFRGQMGPLFGPPNMPCNVSGVCCSELSQKGEGGFGTLAQYVEKTGVCISASVAQRVLGLPETRNPKS